MSKTPSALLRDLLRGHLINALPSPHPANFVRLPLPQGEGNKLLVTLLPEGEGQGMRANVGIFKWSLSELGDIAAFTTEGRTTFMKDAKTRKAVIRSYEVVGEIAKRLPIELCEANPQVNWRQLIGFRDFLAHHYEEVILANIWQAVEDLPNLQSAIEEILAALEHDEPDMTPE